MKSSSPAKRRRASTESASKTDPDDTAQESVHQVMLKTDAEVLKAKAAAKEAKELPMQAAKGDDDLMSEPQKK